MKVKFAVTSVARLDGIPITSGQVIVTLDQIGYYYDLGGNRYKVNDGGSYVTFESELTEGTKIGSIEIDGQSTDIFAPTMPEDLGDLINDLGFITRTSDNLVNYYTKSSTYTKSEINDQIASLSNIDIAVVDELPTTNISTRTIYLVPREHTPSHSSRDEYINIDGTTSGWELIGTADIDVSGLATWTEVNSVLVDYAQASSIPSKTSELTNDSNYTSDPNYVHTDANFTDLDKQKVGQVAHVTVTSSYQEGTEIASITCDGVTTSLHASLGLLPRLIVTTDPDAVVTAEKDGQSTSLQPVSAGVFKGSLSDYGEWSISSTHEGATATRILDVNEVTTYNEEMYAPRTYQGILTDKTWNTYIRAMFTWTDGEHVYCSAADGQYVFNSVTDEWEPKTWNVSLLGNYVWADGDTIYYSASSVQCVLDKTAGSWISKTWNNQPNHLTGNEIWTDGNEIYYSSPFYNDQFVLDKSTDTWNTVTWNVNVEGYHVWTDGTDTYYSSDADHFVLNKTTRTWDVKIWKVVRLDGSVDTDFVAYGAYMFLINGIIYHARGNRQLYYILNRDTGIWEEMTWSKDTEIWGDEFWTDGEHVYYNDTAPSLGIQSYEWTNPK